MRKVLASSFFERPTLKVARELLGKYLVRRAYGHTTAYMITETEAYLGAHDLASHASKGLTPRTRVMFGRPGRWYVYFTYGMHWMLNIVTDKEGCPGAVLVRGADIVSGPARLTKKLKITRVMNDTLANQRTGLWIEDRGIVLLPRSIQRTPRIGVDYAGEWAKKPYRFILKS